MTLSTSAGLTFSPRLLMMSSLRETKYKYPSSSMVNKLDVAQVILAALKAFKSGELKVLVVDMGRDVEQRTCPATTFKVCSKCNYTEMISCFGH